MSGIMITMTLMPKNEKRLRVARDVLASLALLRRPSDAAARIRSVVVAIEPADPRQAEQARLAAQLRAAVQELGERLGCGAHILQKQQAERGQARSLNMLNAAFLQSDCRLRLHVEDNWMLRDAADLSRAVGYLRSENVDYISLTHNNLVVRGPPRGVVVNPARTVSRALIARLSRVLPSAELLIFTICCYTLRPHLTTRRFAQVTADGGGHSEDPALYPWIFEAKHCVRLLDAGIRFGKMAPAIFVRHASHVSSYRGRYAFKYPSMLVRDLQKLALFILLVAVAVAAARRCLRAAPH